VFYIASGSFIEGSHGSPYHEHVVLNSARQMAWKKNLFGG